LGAELKGLIDSYVNDEVLYRAGVAMGLDRDDPVVRRRVLQKLQLISEESTALSPPSDAELEAYLRSHADKYAQSGTISFDQVMFDPLRHGNHTQADMTAALAKLRDGAAPQTVTDSSLLPTHISSMPTDRVAGEFGDEFSAALLSMEQGSWQGPVKSGYGSHWVRVNQKTPGRAPTLAETRTAVQRDWENERRLQATDAYLRKLKESYDIVIETHPAAAATLGQP
jgi:hypothetical protein